MKLNETKLNEMKINNDKSDQMSVASVSPSQSVSSVERELSEVSSQSFGVEVSPPEFQLELYQSFPEDLQVRMAEAYVTAYERYCGSYGVGSASLTRSSVVGSSDGVSSAAGKRKRTRRKSRKSGTASVVVGGGSEIGLKSGDTVGGVESDVAVASAFGMPGYEYLIVVKDEYQELVAASLGPSPRIRQVLEMPREYGVLPAGVSVSRVSGRYVPYLSGPSVSEMLITVAKAVSCGQGSFGEALRLQACSPGLAGFVSADQRFGSDPGPVTEQHSGVSDKGFCYLALVVPESRLKCAGVLGRWPTLCELMKMPKEMFLPVSELYAFTVVRVSARRCHIALGAGSSGVTVPKVIASLAKAGVVCPLGSVARVCCEREIPRERDAVYFGTADYDPADELGSLETDFPGLSSDPISVVSTGTVEIGSGVFRLTDHLGGLKTPPFEGSGAENSSAVDTISSVEEGEFQGVDSIWLPEQPGKTTSSFDGVVIASHKESAHVPRPMNAFLLYRRDNHAEQVAAGLTVCQASKVIATKWHSESEALKNKYRRRAAHDSLIHRINNPDYKFKPRKPYELKRRVKKIQSEQVGGESKDVTALPCIQGDYSVWDLTISQEMLAEALKVMMELNAGHSQVEEARSLHPDFVYFLGDDTMVRTSSLASMTQALETFGGEESTFAAMWADTVSEDKTM